MEKRTWFSKLFRSKEDYEEERRKRFEQIVNGQAVVVGQANECKIIRKSTKLETPKVSVEEKQKILSPNKKELKQIATKTITFIRGNRRVGRRLVKQKVDRFFYEETVNRLLANLNYVIHPRTKDLIISTSTMDNQKPIFATKTLTVFDKEVEIKVKYAQNTALVTPSKPYHRRKNQQLRKGYRFILNEDKEIVAQKFDKANEIWIDIKSNQVKFKKTYQYKTVWFTKRSRRK